MNRETIAKAILNRLENAKGFVTYSRKLQHWDVTPPSHQPALFLQSNGEQIERARGLPAKVTMSYSIYVYAHADNSGELPQTVQNKLLDAIDAALVYDTSAQEYALTLGGLVHDCRVEGKIETDEGLLGKQTVLIIPLIVIAST